MNICGFVRLNNRCYSVTLTRQSPKLIDLCVTAGGKYPTRNKHYLLFITTIGLHMYILATYMAASLVLYKEFCIFHSEQLGNKIRGHSAATMYILVQNIFAVKVQIKDL